MIDGKQIAAASIPIAKLVSSPLLPGTAVAWTVNQDAGSQKLTNLGAPTTGTDAARLQDIQNIPWKEACRVASTANLTQSGTQTIDGVSAGVGDRVLCKDQTTGSQNGIWVVASGAWARAADADSTAELKGAVVVISEGTTNADKRFALVTDSVTVGTTSQSWVDIGTGGSAAYPTASNKAMAASLTTADFNSACATTIATTPSGDGYVRVLVNGIGVKVGNGVRTDDCYFSSDGGTTAKSIANIASGDTLYWVGSVAGYQLATTDKIDFDYAV